MNVSLNYNDFIFALPSVLPAHNKFQSTHNFLMNLFVYLILINNCDYEMLRISR